MASALLTQSHIFSADLVGARKKDLGGKRSSCLHAAGNAATALLFCLRASPVKVGK